MEDADVTNGVERAVSTLGLRATVTCVRIDNNAWNCELDYGSSRQALVLTDAQLADRSAFELAVEYLKANAKVP